LEPHFRCSANRLAATTVVMVSLAGCSSTSSDGLGSPRRGPSTTLSSGGDSQPPLTDTPSRALGASCENQGPACNHPASATGQPITVQLSPSSCEPIGPDGRTQCQVTARSTADSPPVELDTVAVHDASPGSTWTLIESCRGQPITASNVCTIRIAVRTSAPATGSVAATLHVMGANLPAILPVDLVAQSGTAPESS
jgi:hypothetical protein